MARRVRQASEELSRLILGALFLLGCYHGPPQVADSPSPPHKIEQGFRPGFLYWLVPVGSAASACRSGALATARGVTALDVLLGIVTYGIFTPTHSAAVCADTLEPPPHTEADHLADALAPAAAYGTAVECYIETCKQEWERSQFWIAKHSNMKIQTATDVVIDTYNPGADNVRSYGFSITKEPIADGRYRISFDPRCRAVQFVSCSPSELNVKRAFYFYVVTGQDLLVDISGLRGIR